jgi:hypothetical protein
LTFSSCYSLLLLLFYLISTYLSLLILLFISLLILLLLSLLFLPVLYLPLLFFSSYIYTVCCITDMHIKHTLGKGTTLVNGKIYRKKPAKCPSLEKNPPKYTTAYIVQQSNCRWRCEPTFFLGWAFNNEQSIHTLPLQSLPRLSLPLYNPSLYKPSVSSSLSV